jgi:hypothetical protein
MFEERLEICKKCPICDIENWICNARLYINPKTNDIAVYPKKGYFKGCGCAILRKYKNPQAICPAGKWSS